MDSAHSSLINFVTLVDENYLSQLLAMRHSLMEHCSEAHLWILCVSQEAFTALSSFNLPGVTLLQPSQYETPSLSVIRSERSRKEYCWTLTPISILTALRIVPELDMVTYIDADLFFVQSPLPALKELEASGKSILITEHGYHPLWDKSATSGRFNVQFIVVRRDGQGVIEDWEARCREWCFDRHENGLIGDQGYLNEWPELFPEKVHVSEHTEFFQGPWNAYMFAAEDALVFHMHAVSIRGGRLYLKGPYPISWNRNLKFYRPYSLLLRELTNQYPVAGDVAAPVAFLTKRKLSELVTRLKLKLKVLSYQWDHRAEPLR